MAAKNVKKSQSTNRTGSANKNEAASIAASLGGQDAKKRGVVVWPEWSDADINGEKWDVVAHKGKEKDKGKSPVVQHLFDDPDGKIEFPPSAFKVDCWKRPQDYVTEKTPVIVDPDGQHSFDLMSANEHVHENEVMRWITSQITALWRQSAIKPEDSGPGGILGALTGAPDPTPAPGGAPLEGDHTHSWRPWEHIYAINKVGRGPNIPAYNAHGKYVVKLYWMGCWRKIVIDDLLPFDEDDRLLLPATTMQHELWPMLLTKALIKIASIDYNGGSPSCEFGDFSVIHSLTGWLPETIPLQYGHLQEIWNLLRTSLPEFKLPEAPPEAPAEGEKKTDEAAQGDLSKEDCKVEKEKEKSAAPTEKTDSKGKEAKKEGKDKDKGKDDKKDKKDKGDKDKDKMKEKSIVQEEIPLPEHPEMMVFAAYSGQPKYPVRISVLGEMADASERLRQSGISHLYPHPVLLTQTRACPLEPPPPPEKVPAWKLIRPRKKKATPSDEPINVEEKKPIQCLEITSPFIHYKVSPVPIPTDVHRPKSSLERGSTRVCSRPGTANVDIIEETDENAPIPDPQPPQILKVESPKPEEPKEELLKETLQLIAAPRGPQDLDSLGRLSSLSVFSDISDTSTSTCVSDKSSEDLSAKSSKTKRSRRGSALQAAPSPSPLPTTPELDKPVEASSKPTTAKSRKKGSGVMGKQRGSSDSVEGVAPSPKPSLEKKITGQKSAGRRQNSASSRDVKSKGDSQGTAKDTKDMKSTTSSQQGSVVGPYDPVAVLDSVTPTVEGAELAECMVGPDGEPISAAAPDTSEDVEIKSQDIWMDFETFCKCFKTLYIFHKPHTYLCNHKHSDLKTVQLAPGAGSKDKKSAPSTAVSSSDDKSPHYLFVDNLKPTEIVVSFSALCRWNEPPPPPTKEDSKTHIKGKASDRDSKVDALTLDSTSLLEGGTESLLPLEPINQGLLVAEPYSWKSLVIGQPILRLRTTATRAAVLSLPAGRHVLRFNMAAPLGYHIHLTSTVHCVFGDEEKVMAELTKESCRFVDNATQIMVSMGKCIHGFHDPLQLSPALVEFYQIHCPYHADKHASKQYHYKLFLEAFFLTVRKVLLDGQLATPEMAFAWRVFHFDVTTKNPLALHYSSTSRPATGVTSSDRGSAGGKKAAGGGSNKKQATQPVESTENTAENKVDYWRHKEVTPEEHVAAVKIQRCWRGYYVRKVKTARTPGTELNLKVQETLQKAYSVIEPQSEQIGLQLLRNMFKTDPDLMTKYPFYQDEWNKISYADYQGAYPDQPPNTWFVVFREIFYVAEEMLCVPKLYVPINTCMLRVINNDNGEEVPRVFQKVTPYVYKKNKKGYTFVAEARTTEQPLVSGRWRMRLIGSLSPLPSPSKNEVNCSFHTRELRDYYLPNDTNVILRYTVKVQEDHVVSLQLSTSKHDVYAKLQVMDGQQELYSAMGKGHVVLPAVIFQKDPGNDDGETKRSGSRASNKGGKAHGVSSTKDVSKKRVGSATDGRASRSSTRSRHSIVSVEEDDDMKPHKYIIQATVLRNSWPLSESQWAFVQILKDMEKNELKVANKERAPSPPRSEKAPSQSSKGKDKGAKGKGGKDKDKTSRPPSQQFDITKPNWTLRIVSEGQAAEEVEVKKDVERAEEIRAMKRAWEEAEPGRAAKALQSRLQYLNSHTIKPRSEDDTASTEEPQSEENQTVSPIPPLVTLDSVPDSDTNLTLEPPPAPTPKETLPTVDLTPFLKKTTGTPRLRDDTEIARQMEAKQKEIQAYRAYREEVERCREIDRQQRNQAKIDQLHMCENMQASLDTAREAINAPREAFRQRFLDAERRRLEEIAAQEANFRAEQEKNAPTPKGRKSAKGKKSPSVGKKKK